MKANKLETCLSVEWILYKVAQLLHSYAVACDSSLSNGSYAVVCDSSLSDGSCMFFCSVTLA